MRDRSVRGRVPARDLAAAPPRAPRSAACGPSQSSRMHERHLLPLRRAEAEHAGDRSVVEVVTPTGRRACRAAPARHARRRRRPAPPASAAPARAPRRSRPRPNPRPRVLRPVGRPRPRAARRAVVQSAELVGGVDVERAARRPRLRDVPAPPRAPRAHRPAWATPSTRVAAVCESITWAWMPQMSCTTSTSRSAGPRSTRRLASQATRATSSIHRYGPSRRAVAEQDSA